MSNGIEERGGIQMAKVDTSIWEQNTEAVREFTDREEPQEAFERKFRVFSDDWKNEYYVLCYYGIGGIGKTSFANKLRRVIRGEEKTRLLEKIDCNYIEYNFDAKNSSLDKEGILASFRNQLMKVNKDFQFFRFNYALCCYAQKIGKAEEKEEAVKSLLEKTPWLKRMFSLAEFIPVVSSVTSLVKKIDSLTSDIRGIYGEYMDKKRFRDYLFEIDRLEATEILNKLHEYFCLDMIYNMQHVAKKTIVVFIDTYEKYIDTLNQEISMIIEDYWLRKGKKSVIRSIPGVLWVITGREKLYWSDDDDWEEFVVDSPLSEMTDEEKEILAKTELEQHLLGDLSEVDAISFLSKAGINNIDLCKQLYELTNGTPLFLDMCVENYNEVFTGEVMPTIDMFGKDLTQLISRYLYNMNEGNREMLYFLSCLGKWDDDTVKEIASKVTLLRNYTYAKYQEFLRHPFIIYDSEGAYYMHETVRSAAIKNAETEIINEISRIHLLVLKKRVESSIAIEHNMAIIEYVRVLAEKSYRYDEIYEHIMFIQKQFVQLKSIGNYDLLYMLSNKLFYLVSSKYSNMGVDYIIRGCYAEALSLKGYVKEALKLVEGMVIDNESDKLKDLEWLLIKQQMSAVYYENGMYRDTLEIRKEVLEKMKKVLGEEHPDTLRAMANLADIYHIARYNRDEFKIRTEAIEGMKKVLGEEHPDTLMTMNNLGNNTFMVSRSNALEIRKEVSEKMKKVLGEEHPNTLHVMSDLATSYNTMGEYAMAFEIRKQISEKMKQVLGEQHPDTLKAMSATADSYERMGEKNKAIEIRKEVLRIRKEVLGEQHPDTLRSMGDLASVYGAIGEYKEVVKIREERLMKRTEKFGYNNTVTRLDIQLLASAYSKIGEYQKLSLLYNEVFEVYKKIKSQEWGIVLSNVKEKLDLLEKK